MFHNSTVKQISSCKNSCSGCRVAAGSSSLAKLPVGPLKRNPMLVMPPIAIITAKLDQIILHMACWARLVPPIIHISVNTTLPLTPIDKYIDYLAYGSWSEGPYVTSEDFRHALGRVLVDVYVRAFFIPGGCVGEEGDVVHAFEGSTVYHSYLV